ncbi:MAG: DUF2341 domain-containing protein, partial [Candidatus Thermoplasmatota archaeon]|nr:DUF2341 domain-containing protein [Candidatus Thermoplasmatota archaeon]
MSYNVTTDPDIGSDSGGLKPDGIYTIPITGLESLTTYTWYIQVTDGKDTVEKTCSFITEPVAPIISNPMPTDGERHVPTDLQMLHFTLKDYQGDAMDYTVETSPFIGSGAAAHVHNGTYTVPVTGLQNFTTYRWFINATDGQHWTRKTFSFQTDVPSVFDPFAHGWTYRKQITISHTKISETLTNFPVLININDNDLSVHAQEDGDDILFMNDTGIATRLNYEIERYQGNSGEVTAWVNITQLSSTEDTTFYLYYGHPTTLSLQNIEKTWDENYVAVWHFKETEGNNLADSTRNHFNGTANAFSTITTGVIGNARSFDGVDSGVYVGTQSEFGGRPTYTIEAWGYPFTTSGEHRIFDRSQSYHNNPNTILFCQQNCALEFASNNYDSIRDNNAFQINSWRYLVGTYIGSGGEKAIYVNGAKTTNGTTIYESPTQGNFNVNIGECSFNWGFHWDGILDEMRFSKIARSSEWINTSYQNQNDPGSFFAVGPEEPAP